MDLNSKDLNSRDLNSNNIHTLDLTKPVLFVDLGYMLFYKFYSTRTWYRCRHYDEKIPKNTRWDNIEEFTNMYKNKFFDKLEKIVKKYNVPHSNIIMARDCRRCKIWRMDIYPKYKGTREESHRRCGFNGHELFNYTTTKLIPDFIKRTGALLFHYDDTEADDIIAVLSQYIRSKKTNLDIIIIANDNDYLQLVDPHLKIIDFKNKIISDKVLDINNPKYGLTIKILLGDRSDNIPACYMLSEVYKIYDPSKSKSRNKYLKCNKKIACYYASNLDKLSADIVKYPELFKDNQYKINQSLIDFNYIPSHIRTKIIYPTEEPVVNQIESPVVNQIESPVLNQIE